MNHFMSRVGHQVPACRSGNSSSIHMQTQTALRKNIKHQEIAIRAYQIWEAAGHPAGCELQHWLQAEQELGASRGGKPSAVPLPHEEVMSSGKRQPAPP